MSYCVNCGVELDKTAAFCPLCHTPVINPNQPPDLHSPTPFPTERREVPPANKRELALLISAMLASVAICCGTLNLFLRAGHVWSLYVIGAAVMLWVWLVPPLIFRNIPAKLELIADCLAIAVYVLLICIDLSGWDWYLHFALPVICLLCALALFLEHQLREVGRSILSSATLCILSVGVFVIGLEFFGDLYFQGSWAPGWSLIVLTVCAALAIPLLVIRRVPTLREEVRRRFHL